MEGQLLFLENDETYSRSIHGWFFDLMDRIHVLRKKLLVR
jgi:hypothetical protein